MGCSSCGKARQEAQAAAAAYPKQVVLADGTTVTVTSSADERVKRQAAEARMRQQAEARGYTVTRR